MAILDIITFPDPILKKEAEPIENIDESIHLLILDMADTLYSVQGIGLAAPQVGVSKQLLLYDLDRNDLAEGLSEEQQLKCRNYKVIINPKIISAEGEFLSENEGCLSVPDFRADVHRAQKIHLKAIDENGKNVDINTDEFLAVLLQHEVDHLRGILFIDYVSSLKRQMYKRRIMKDRKKKKRKEK
ncbi:peptide deformylase [Candidatus Magnetomorum sp. HK-1]|nr:peptide deformylase [Candidatus Magnetomorum sp. HK-1]